jgi:hypothetical protein
VLSALYPRGAVLIDGSFVTAKPDPNDIDIVLVVAADYNFSKDLAPTTRRTSFAFGFSRTLCGAIFERFLF